jgi:hypothetical protein
LYPRTILMKTKKNHEIKLTKSQKYGRNLEILLPYFLFVCE